MAAAVDAVPLPATTTHDGDYAAAATAEDDFPSLLVPVSAFAYGFVSTCVSEHLAYYATSGVYLAFLARDVWPDRVDAVLGTLGGHARRAALLAREDLEADLQILRDHPATAPAFARAEACARRARDAVAGCLDGARRRVEAKWAEHRDAAGVAWLLLRLAGRAARVAVTVLLDAAREEVKAHAPAVLAYLRGLVPAGIRSPATEEGDGDVAAGFELRDVVSIVGIAFYLLLTIRFILSFDNVSRMQFYGAFSVVMGGLAVLVADWIDPPEDDDSNDNDATAGDKSADDDTTQQEGNDAGDQARLDAGLEKVRKSWQFMYFLIFMASCFDAVIFHAAFGPQIIELLLLGVVNLEVMEIGKVVQRTADDDGEGAEGSAVAAGGGVDEAVDSWRRGAVSVFVASSIKVFGIYLIVDFYMAALSIVWLIVMADFLLDEEDRLLELCETGDDEDTEEEDASSSEDVNGDAEEGAAEARAAEHSDTSSSEDEEEDSSDEGTNTTSSEDDEEEDYVLQDRCDSSEERADVISSEDEEEDATEEHCDGSGEHDKEERQGEQGCSRGGSMDDGWDFIEVDPEMPVKGETGAKKKSSSLLPWK